MGFDLTFVWEALPTLLSYLPITLLLTVVAMAIAIVLGLALALVRFRRVPVLSQLAALHISFYRGVPTLVLLFLTYYGLPQVWPGFAKTGAMTAAIVGLCLKESAYLGEIFRAALVSVDRGQYEAGLATGMTPTQVYRRYVLPQAAHNALPATGNTFIGLLKETSVVFTLGITEMFASAQMIAANNFRYLETYLTVGLLYWGVVVVVGALLDATERRLARPYER